MPPKAKKQCIRDKFTLTCEWSDCKDVFSKMDEFLKHISEHINQMLPKSPISEGRADLVCQWRECGHRSRSGDYRELIRHIYFHAFHVKIKSIGMNMILQDGMEGCLLDSQSRNMIPELPERLQCGWHQCDGIYDNPEHFYRHVKSHPEMEPEGNNPPGGCKCQWEGCSTLVRNKYKLRDHLRSHTQEKVIACPTCGGLFSNRTRFVDHINRQSDVENLRFQCSHCNKRFSTERLLRDHMRQHVNHYKCPFCDMTCPNPSGLRSHFKYRHTQERPFKCDHCDYSCKTMGDLRKHIEGHNDAPQFVCQVESCDFKCRAFVSYSAHFKKAHQGQNIAKYVCHVCNMMFTRGSNLTLHLKNKHKFKWPSGHARFRYKLHDDGFYRLQTVRYESIELTEQLLGNPDEEEAEEEEIVEAQATEIISNPHEEEGATSVGNGDYEQGTSNGETLNVVLDSVNEIRNDHDEVIISAGGGDFSSEGRIVTLQMQPLAGVDGTHLHLESSEGIISDSNTELHVEHVYVDSDLQETAKAMGIAISE